MPSNQSTFIEDDDITLDGELDFDKLITQIEDDEKMAMKDLDEAAERAGGYVDNLVGKDVHYDLRGIAKYCKDKGIEPIDMTLRELRNFIIY